METPKIFESEYHFCLIMWEHEPVTTVELVKLCLVSKEQAQAREIDELVDEKFQGSLPAFVAAFTKRQDISSAELDEVQHMIDRIRKGDQA